MESIDISNTKALELTVLHERAQEANFRTPEGLHKITANKVAMLVDPVNGDPFVFMPPKTVVVFRFQPGSGTDHLRQRALADIFFESLESKPQRRPSP